MNLAESSFLVFLALVVPFYALAARVSAQAALGALLLCSALFYASWNPAYLLLLAATVVTDYNVGRALARTSLPGRRRALLLVSLGVDLTLLAAFKYFDQLAAGWSLASGAPLPRFRLLFVTGISFYTFQSLSYVIDVYRHAQAPAKSLAHYAAFVSFFPTLLAGPITRASMLLPQLETPPSPMDPLKASEGLLLIALGFVKKGLIADTLADQLARRVFEQPLFYSSFEVLCGLYAYAVQIYCDFSGYSDIAIGAALLLGIRLKDNFRSPYRATTLAEFWKRWHISFSSWLQDYVFFSLPGNRRGSFRPYLNILITFVVGGLWHGASWGFLIWGVIHGSVLAFERRFVPPLRVSAPWWRRALGAVVTFHVVLVAWVFFGAESLERVGEIAHRLAAFTTGAGNVPASVLALIAAVLALQWLPEAWADRAQAAFWRLPALAQAACLLAVAAIVHHAAGSAIAPFIYQGF